MANVPDLLNELIRRLTDMRNAYTALASIPAAGRTSIDTLILKNIDQWTRGTGSTFGHLAEFDKYYSHRVKKGRVVASAKGKGDVVIGAEGDPFAKTIQSKAITSEKHNAVEGHIEKAVEQIAGLYHETPRKQDHLAVNIIIFNEANTWPFTPHEVQHAFPSMGDLRSRITTQVVNAINRVIRTSSSAAVNSLSQNLNRTPFETHKKPGPNTSAIHRTLEKPVAWFDPVRGPAMRSVTVYEVTPTFYVKINWPFGYSVNDGTLKILTGITLRYNSSANRLEVTKERFA